VKPSAGPTLVAGSYPPIPVPSAQATLSAVRRELDAGREVKILSPRPSAAHYSIPITGLMAGRRLTRAKALSGCDRLVLCLEPGVPFAPPGRRDPAARAAARLLARAMRRFSHTTLIVTGDVGAPAKAMSLLQGAADEVLEDRRPGEPPDGVTVRGPKEVTQRDRARRLAGKAVRRVLGPERTARVGVSWLPVIVLMAVVTGACGMFLLVASAPDDEAVAEPAIAVQPR